MTIEIKYDEAVEFFENLVEQYPDDYVVECCTYFLEDVVSTPNCIVGHLLAYKGITLQDLDVGTGPYGGPYSYNSTVICHIFTRSNLIAADDKTRYFLVSLQEQQDVRVPWKTALQLAKTDTEAAHPYVS